MDVFQGKSAIREKLLSDATHRMKNLMGGIGGFAALLLKELPQEGSQYPLALRIHENLVRLDGLIGDVMTLVRDRSLHYETIDLPSALREICAQCFEDEASEMAGFIPIETSRSRIALRADPLMFRNAFANGFRFIRTLSNNVESIRITEGTETIEVGIHFKSEMNLVPLRDDPIEGLDAIDSLETRLSWVLSVKLIRLHGGRVTLNQGSDDTWILAYTLSKG